MTARKAPDPSSHIRAGGAKRSLQRRIVASVMLGLGIVLVGLGYLVTLAFTSSRDAALHERLAVAQAKQHELHQEIEDALELLTRMGRQDLQPSLRPEAPSLAHERLQHILDEAGVFSAVALFHPEGGVIAAAGPSAWLRSLPRDAPLLDNERPQVFEVDVPPAAVGLSTPVLTAQGETLWLLAQLDPSRLMRHLASDHLGFGMYKAEVLTGKGWVVVSSGEAPPLSNHTRLIAELAREYRAGTVLHKPGRGRPDHYVAYVPLTTLPGWGVIVEQPRDVVVALPLRLRRWMVGIGAFVLLAATLVAWLDVRRVTTPLNALMEAAKGIGRGDLATPVRVAGHDEVGLLGRTLEEMRARLQRSREELQERERQAQALLGVSTQILAARGRDEVLGEVAAQAAALLEREAALVCLRENASNTLRMVAAAGPQEAFSRRDATATAEQGDPCSLLAEIFRPAYLGAPLKVGEHTMGWLCVGGRLRTECPPSDTTLLSGLASLASLAVENARLQGEAQSVATLQERERIARELHDGLAQALGALHNMAATGQLRLAKGEVEGIERVLKEMADLSARAYEDVRQSIFGLRIMVSHGLGLIPAITEYLHEFSERSGVRVRLVVEKEVTNHLAPEVEIQLVRIIQEALSNVWRHAGVRAAVVRLGEDHGMVRVVVEDTGFGFDPSAAPTADGRHFGLQTMRERAESVGGTLAVESTPGAGTRIDVRVPRDR